MRQKLARLELQIMEILWNRGPCSIREIQEAFPEKDRPAFTTIQTTAYRMEAKKAVRIAKRVGNANIFEAAVTRRSAENRLIDDLLGMFGGRVKPVIARLVETGKLTLDDIKEAEQAIRNAAKDKKR
ncbi:MAG TPA: BlaI/MecI/CopY family transcriptional regulator [Candidatus Limnocylindrales bacterium]|nr:BlaI/MecI/CopY family transcriptional regulator [Candidatus Limnocylindrales bacterium]